MIRSRRGAVLALSLSVWCMGGGCGEFRAPAAPPPEPPAPDVILVTIDTLRADHLSCYGFRGGATLFAEAERSEAARTGAWRSGRWKYLRHFSGGWEKLFNLEADPLEKNDLVAVRPAVLARLRAEMDSHYATRSAGHEAPLRGMGEDELERLRALGYVED